MTNNNFFPFLHNSQKPLVEKNKSCRAINEKNCVCRFFVWRNFYVCLEKLLFIGLLKQINEKCMTNDDVWSCVWGWLGFCGAFLVFWNFWDQISLNLRWSLNFFGFWRLNCFNFQWFSSFFGSCEAFGTRIFSIFVLVWIFWSFWGYNS